MATHSVSEDALAVSQGISKYKYCSKYKKAVAFTIDHYRTCNTIRITCHFTLKIITNLRNDNYL